MNYIKHSFTLKDELKKLLENKENVDDELVSNVLSLVDDSIQKMIFERDIKFSDNKTFIKGDNLNDSTAAKQGCLDVLRTRMGKKIPDSAICNVDKIEGKNNTFYKIEFQKFETQNVLDAKGSKISMMQEFTNNLAKFNEKKDMKKRIFANHEIPRSMKKHFNLYNALAFNIRKKSNKRVKLGTKVVLNYKDLTPAIKIRVAKPNSSPTPWFTIEEGMKKHPNFITNEIKALLDETVIKANSIRVDLSKFKQ